MVSASFVPTVLCTAFFQDPPLSKLTHICRNKAVSDGAVSFYLNRRVRGRVARMAYGIMGYRYYDPEDCEHHARRSQLIKDARGDLVLPHCFQVIIPKVSYAMLRLTIYFNLLPCSPDRMPQLQTRMNLATLSGI
jgi:hypothetical protein